MKADKISPQRLKYVIVKISDPFYETQCSSVCDGRCISEEIGSGEVSAWGQRGGQT